MFPGTLGQAIQDGGDSFGRRCRHLDCLTQRPWEQQHFYQKMYSLEDLIIFTILKHFHNGENFRRQDQQEKISNVALFYCKKNL